MDERLGRTLSEREFLDLRDESEVAISPTDVANVVTDERGYDDIFEFSDYLVLRKMTSSGRVDWAPGID